VKSKSRFGIVSTLVVAILALLYVLPAFASDSTSTITGTAATTGSSADRTVTVSVHASSFAAASVAADASVVIGASVAQDTKVGSTIYVAAATTAYDVVLVQVIDLDTATGNANAGSGNDTITVTVKNLTSGASINGTTLQLLESVTAGTFQGKFQVTSTGGVAGQIAASDTQVIRVGHASSGVNIDLTVDAVKPAITSTAPAHGGIVRIGSAVFSGTITDAGSGLRADGSGEDLDNNGVNEAGDRDGDGITGSEPMTTGTSGATKDVGINVGIGATGDGDFQDALDFSKLASLGWSAVTDGYAFAFTKGDLAEAVTYWEVVARDRVGNTATTDSDGPTLGNNAFKLTVDKTAPAIEKVETGIGYNATTKKETVSRKSLKVTFTKSGLAGGAADFLDTTTLDVGDFRVEKSSTDTSVLELAASGLTHPNISVTAIPATSRSKTIAGVDIETRHVIYLTLVNDLVGNGKPRVKSIGNYGDLAANPAAPHGKVAVDKIAPKITLTVTGSASPRPVATGATTGKMTIRVVTDEPLNAAPTIYAVDFKWDDTTDDRLEVRTAGGAITPTAVAGLTNTWETTQTLAGAGVAAGLFGVHVIATDTSGNAGDNAGVTTAAAGSAPVAGNAVDLSKATLAEFDATLPTPTVTLTPTTANATTTESTGPFIKVAFGEGKEAQINTTGGTDPADATPVDKLTFAQATGAAVSVEIDSHNTVTLTKLDLVDADGNITDLLGTQGVVAPDSFVVALSGLSTGTYTVKVNGTDVVGNKLAADSSFVFTIAARSAYSVALSPGFNLISLPGDPTDTSLDSVLPATHPATTVLSYQPNDANGPWLVATRASGEAWSSNAANTLSTITSGNGYWVQTGAFAPLKTLIPERDPSQVLPTFPLVAGWNLIGVVDLTLGATTATISADVYLASISWTVAYTFDTQSNKWTKITKASAPAGVLYNGQGVWVWVEKKDVLAP